MFDKLTARMIEFRVLLARHQEANESNASVFLHRAARRRGVDVLWTFGG